MCIAELNVSLNECSHRWYHMLRPCVPGGNLNSCPGKIALEGWETRCDFCPFCANWPLESGEYLLFGGSPHSRRSSISTPLSRTPSLSTSVHIARRDSRREDLVRTGSSSSISNVFNGIPAPTSPVSSTGERNKALNSRVDTYFESHPEPMVEARSRRSVYNSWGLPRADEAEEALERRASSSTNSSATIGRDTAAGRAAKTWLKVARRKSSQVTSLFR